MEDRLAEPLLQHLHHARDRRLAGAEAECCFGKAAGIADLGNDHQMLWIDLHEPSIPERPYHIILISRFESLDFSISIPGPMILARSQQTTWEEPHEGQLENLRHCRSAGAMELTRMLYVIHGVDKPRSPIRDRLIDAHHAYLASSGLSIVGSGPLMDDPGETPIGTVIIADCASRTEAARIMAAEPFNRAGLYESLQITRWAARDQSGGERHMDEARPDNSSSRHKTGDEPGHAALRDPLIFYFLMPLNDLFDDIDHQMSTYRLLQPSESCRAPQP